MINENTSQEQASERMPSPEEIKSAIETVLKGKEYLDFKETCVEHDETGVSRYEVVVMLENGESIEFNFQKAIYDYRDASLPESARYSASIHEFISDADGMPTGGGCVANYLNGVWEYVS